MPMSTEKEKEAIPARDAQGAERPLLDGRYRLDTTIGEGATARVYRAFDLKEKREVAVKIFKQELSKDEEARRRFTDEAKAYTILENHPNIISAYDISTAGDEPYIVMELAEGESLMHRLNYRGGRLDLQEAMNISFQLLAALSYAHKKGVIHRDVKPQNVILLEGDLVKLADFGIAILPGMEEKTVGAAGTVHYMSPEQISGGRVDARSDIYSVGVVMYEMLTGHVPFSSDQPRAADRINEIMHKHLKEMPVKPSSYSPNLPTAVEQIILKALSKPPAARFASCEEMSECLHLAKGNPNLLFEFGLNSAFYDEYAALPEESAAERFTPRIGQKASAGKGNGKISEGKKPEEKNNRVTARMAACFMVLFVLAAGVVTFALWDIFWRDAGKTTVVTTGGLLYQPYDDAAAASLAEKGYEVTICYEYSEHYPAGTVISQSPDVGAAQRLAPGEAPHLTLTLSAGFRVMLMNDYCGREYRAVEQELTGLGFTVQVVKIHSEEATGLILATDPAPGAMATQNEPVTLTVSEGPATVYRYMPSLLGMTAKQAMAALEEAGLRLGGIVYETSSATPGTVIAQNHAYGEKLPAEYMPVILVIAKNGIPS